MFALMTVKTLSGRYSAHPRTRELMFKPCYMSDYNYTLLDHYKLLPLEQKGSPKNYRQWYKQVRIRYNKRRVDH